MEIKERNLNHKSFFKGTIIFSLSQLSVQVIGLVRNSLIGHAVSPADFGKAAVFALVISLVESLSEFSAEKLVLQYRFGCNSKLVASIHLFNVLKGFLSSTIIILLQPFFLFFFDLGDASWGLYLIAFIPIIKGFSNIDYIKEQRKLNFKYNVYVELSGQLMALITVCIVLIYYADYKAALFSLLAQALFFNVASHFFSKSKYKIRYSRTIFCKIISFGWPLLLNGLALFVILQGDKFIISKYFNMEILGYYSALSILAFIPVVIATKILMNTLLPLYSSKVKIKNSYINYFPFIVCIGYLFFTLMFEDFIINIVFGKQYLNQGYIFKALVIMWFFRLMQTKKVIQCIAAGDTKIPLKTTLIRMLFVPFGFLLVNVFSTVESIVIAGAFGEISALIYIYFKNNKVENES